MLTIPSTSSSKLLPFCLLLVLIIPDTVSTTVPLVDFDSGSFSSFSNTGSYDWTLLSGSTSSVSTGPSGDHTSGTGYYAYVEASTPNYPYVGPFILQMNVDGLKLASFWYSMYGVSIGTLMFDTSSNDGSSWTTQWTKSGNQGTSWQEAELILDGASITDIRFYATTGINFYGDIAIDDISITTNTPSPTVSLAPSISTLPTPLPSSVPTPVPTMDGTLVDFDSGSFSPFSNTASYDWTLLSGATNSVGTGPSGDHTSGTGYYAYVEASTPNSPNQGPFVLQATVTDCGGVSFWYNMYGGSIGVLMFDTSSNDGSRWTTQWSKSGNQGNSWQQAELVFIDASITDIRFYATTGTSFEGDIAIDDIFISDILSPAPSISPVPTTSPAPTSMPTLTQSPTIFEHTSCTELLDRGYDTSGVYTIYPGTPFSDNTLTPYEVYCDMETDGGGWMLTWAYNHKSGVYQSVQSSATPPTSKENNTHIELQAMGIDESDIRDVRFYCTSTQHSRVMHFKSSNSIPIQAVHSDSTYGNSDYQWTHGTKLLSNHSAYLPKATEYTSSSSTNGIALSPFYAYDYSLYGGYVYWGMNQLYGSAYHWDCDNFDTIDSYDTQHLIYTRMKSSKNKSPASSMSTGEIAAITTCSFVALVIVFACCSRSSTSSSKASDEENAGNSGSVEVEEPSFAAAVYEVELTSNPLAAGTDMNPSSNIIDKESAELTLDETKAVSKFKKMLKGGVLEHVVVQKMKKRNLRDKVVQTVLNEFHATETITDEESAELTIEETKAVFRFKKMLKTGVPEQAVVQKMQNESMRDEVIQAVLDTFYKPNQVATSRLATAHKERVANSPPSPPSPPPPPPSDASEFFARFARSDTMEDTSNPFHAATAPTHYSAALIQSGPSSNTTASADSWSSSRPCVDAVEVVDVLDAVLVSPGRPSEASHDIILTATVVSDSNGTSV